MPTASASASVPPPRPSRVDSARSVALLPALPTLVRRPFRLRLCSRQKENPRQNPPLLVRPRSLPPFYQLHHQSKKDGFICLYPYCRPHPQTPPSARSSGSSQPCGSRGYQPCTPLFTERHLHHTTPRCRPLPRYKLRVPACCLRTPPQKKQPQRSDIIVRQPLTRRFTDPRPFPVLGRATQS